MSRSRMLLSSLSVLAFTVATSAAFGADLPRREAYPTKAPAYVSPYYNWSGFYAGVNGGGGFFNNGGDGGGFGGGQIGYNWQYNQIVFGVEADAQGGSISRGGTDVIGNSFNDRIDAFGTVRGRLGYAWNSVLLYGTGGYAWADDRLRVTTPAGLNFSNSDTRSGYAVGGGLEWGFAPQWSAKVEYQYLDFGDRGSIFGITAPKNDISTVRVGLNYHFNGW